MGLDMYLTREHYVKNWDWMDEDDKWTISITGPEPIDVSKVVTISEEVYLWHKADVIHRWFVENVQDGEDNCARYYVTFEQLQELAEGCRKVLADLDNDALAEELGLSSVYFHRGYSQDYVEQLSETAKVLADLPEGDYHYSSDW